MFPLVALALVGLLAFTANRANTNTNIRAAAMTIIPVLLGFNRFGALLSGSLYKLVNQRENKRSTFSRLKLGYGGAYLPGGVSPRE